MLRDSPLCGTCRCLCAAYAHAEVPSLVGFSWRCEGRPRQLLTVEAIRTLLGVVLSARIPYDRESVYQ